MSKPENNEPQLYEFILNRQTGEIEKLPWDGKPLPLPVRVPESEPVDEEEYTVHLSEEDLKPPKTPTLDNTPSRDELARDVAEQLRIIEAAYNEALENAHLLPAPKRKNHMDLRNYEDSAISYRDYSAGLADYAEKCGSEADLALIRDRIEVGILMDIGKELYNEGSFPQRSPDLKWKLFDATYELSGLVRQIELRGRLLLALDPIEQKTMLEEIRANNPFYLPDGIEEFHFALMLEIARKNEYLRGEQNLVKLLNNHDHGTTTKQREDLKSKGQIYDWTPQGELLFSRENFAAFLEKFAPKWRVKKK